MIRIEPNPGALTPPEDKRGGVKKVVEGKPVADKPRQEPNRPEKKFDPVTGIELDAPPEISDDARELARIEREIREAYELDQDNPTETKS